MSSYRTEINIPVNKDNRTMEQRRSQTMDRLEQQYPTEATNSRSSSSSYFRTGSALDDSARRWEEPQLWTDRNDGVSDWVSETRKRWDEELERMKSSMFSLESDRDEFDFHSREPFLRPSGLESSFPRHRFDHNLSSHIGRQQQQKQSSLFSSSTSPHSSMKRTTTSNNDEIDRYEIGEDGQLHFKIRFNADNYRPEDINVTCTGNTVSLRATRTAAGEPLELQKTILVPDSVDTKKFQCHLTQDGVLVLEAPVQTPSYSSIVPVQATSRLQSSPMNLSDMGSTSTMKPGTGPVISADASGRRRLRLEIPVDSDYVPSDFSVKTEANSISVKGRHEVKTANSSSFKEFSRYYEVPEAIDPMTVTLTIDQGVLLIEASIH